MISYKKYLMPHCLFLLSYDNNNLDDKIRYIYFPTLIRML